VQHLAGRPVQQRGEERPVSAVEPDLLAMQLPLQSQAGAGGDPRPRETPCGTTSPTVAVDARVTRLMWAQAFLLYLTAADAPVRRKVRLRYLIVLRAQRRMSLSA
jgi:hypothetical protein